MKVTDSKIDAAIAYLADKNMPQYQAYPILFRLMRFFGFAVRPPIFMSRRKLILVSGGYFGVAWMVFMNIVFGYGLFELGMGAIVAGALFGIYTAGYYERRRDELALVSWSEFTADGH